jgi:hypothetical protein
MHDNVGNDGKRSIKSGVDFIFLLVEGDNSLLRVCAWILSKYIYMNFCFTMTTANTAYLKLSSFVKKFN